MHRSMAPLCVLFVCITPVAFSQNYGAVCNAGIDADGFIDFAGLPAAKNIPEGTASAPVTATLPVQGIPGLTVQVTIPSLIPYNGGPLYTVDAGMLSMVGNPESGGSLQLEFNRPVYGVSFEGNAGGRQVGFSIATNEATAKGELDPPGPNFSNGAGNHILGYDHFNYQLQAVGNISEAFLSFPFASYGTPVLSNLRVQSQPSPSTASVPREGLQQWLMSEAAADPYAGPASTWPDQSGNGHNATQTVSSHYPGQTASSGPNCRGGFLFEGQSYFNFHLPIDGWEQMTVFLVSRTFADPPASTYASMSAAILWDENALWGNTFISPAQTSVPFRFGTEQGNNQPIYARPVNLGQDFTVTRAVHDRNIDSLYVDSVPVLLQQNKQPVLAGTSGAAFLGRGINNTYFNGEISEVLIYNRVLSHREAASVESYLRNKFGTK